MRQSRRGYNNKLGKIITRRLAAHAGIALPAGRETPPSV